MPAGSVSTSVAVTVSRMIDEAVVASGCCATLAEDIMTQELAASPGVQVVKIEQAIGQVIVFYDAARIRLDTSRAALDAIDYPAVRPPDQNASTSRP